MEDEDLLRVVTSIVMPETVILSPFRRAASLKLLFVDPNLR